MAVATKTGYIHSVTQELMRSPYPYSETLYKEVFRLLWQIRAYLTLEDSRLQDHLTPKIIAIMSRINTEPNSFSELRHFLEDILDHLSAVRQSRIVERKAWRDEKPSKKVNSIPRMIEKETLKYYKWLGKDLKVNGEIVKLGCWLGASTCGLAEGLITNSSMKGHNIYAFDSFKWEQWMLKFLTNVQKCLLKPEIGNSYLNDFADYCKEYMSIIEPRQSYLYLGKRDGKLKQFFWNKTPIKLYSYGLSGDYDYVSKAWGIFSPSFVPNETIIVFEEYGNLKASGLRKFCREKLQQLHPIHKPNSAVKSFLWVGEND